MLALAPPRLDASPGKDALPPLEVAAAGIGAFFWLLMVVLFIAIIVGYVRNDGRPVLYDWRQRQFPARF